MIYGDAGWLDNGIGGDDTLVGGVGGINYMYGEGHTITVTDAGDDRLISAARTTDHMWGDAQTTDSVSLLGEDTFVFSPHNGRDYVYDFHQGQDIIELDGFSRRRLASFSDLDIQTVDTDGDHVADSSLIQFDHANSVTVYGVIQLTDADFHFIV